CGGFPAAPANVSMKAGSSVTVEVEKSVASKGRHCQFALSYDGGNKFAVIHDVLDDCFITDTKYEVKIPDNLPTAGNVVFALQWYDADEYSKFYMNCADVEIVGVTGGSFTGPEMLVANILNGPSI
ncbi:hypothetical protein BDF22DRAFT_600569, partial [Syncephalis plumigaleata]